MNSLHCPSHGARRRITRVDSKQRGTVERAELCALCSCKQSKRVFCQGNCVIQVWHENTGNVTREHNKAGGEHSGNTPITIYALLTAFTSAVLEEAAGRAG
ncbi:hypothetical protein FQN60_000280 [Etheostoma spectabile]|uniref:Uncharacterized protein n=1 Tax=Etheostoma spectabile TaxID=54343 RepID=A0A5J5CZ98_9PERO|nr:hypothetical protein FQN60_000280 [Etheostoma spectabile]